MIDKGPVLLKVAVSKRVCCLVYGIYGGAVFVNLAIEVCVSLLEAKRGGSENLAAIK